MERKIGEIFEYNGEFYQCVKGDCCRNCDFYDKFKDDICIAINNCSLSHRSDKTSVIFKKLEKVGEPYAYTFTTDKIYNVLMQQYKVNYDEIIPFVIGHFFILNPQTNTIAIELKQNKKDMGDNNIRPYDEPFSPGTVNNTKHLTKENMEEKQPTYEELLHFYHSTVGLWAIDRNPQEVNFDWICKNAFQLGMDKTLPNFEKIGKNLKPFDLEAAKAGKPVCTRDGRKARIICFDANDERPIIALIEFECDNGCTVERIETYYKDGKVHEESEWGNDLMMLPKKKEGWVNIYAPNIWYSSKEEAEANIDQDYEHEYVRTVKMEWEE